MLTKLWKPIAITVLGVSLLLPGATSALAAGTAPTAPTKPAASAPAKPVVSSPEQPLSYTSKTAEIQPGEYHWYAFKYNQDDSNGPMSIKFTTSPDDSTTLYLLNSSQVSDWEQGNALASFGQVTPASKTVDESVSREGYCLDNPTYHKCLDGRDNKYFSAPMPEPVGYSVWSGTIGASGTYYILVHRSAQAGGPGTYSFTVSGDGYTLK